MLIGKVLGPTEIEVDGAVADLGGPLPRRLVATLLAAEGRPVTEDALAEAIWGDEAPGRPGNSLQAYVSRLRRALGRPALARAGDGYRLTVDDTDAARFAADVHRGRQLLDGEQPGDALRLFDAALGRWRGEAYADLPGTPARTRLDELRAVAVEERLAARLAGGDAPGAAGELEAATRAEPYRERRWELLILALYRSGRQAEALAALRRVRDRLADDLGIDPGPALQDLERRVLAQDPGLLLPSRPAPAVRPLSHFFGRAAELTELTEMSGASRLLTLVGPGGAGKTRLAVEYAAGQNPWFVRLADVTDPTLVPAAVAAAMGVRGSSVEVLAAALGDGSGLLLLDNCEHVVVAAAELAFGLLTRCPALSVLATSREPLGVDGERLLPVAPLPAADAIALLTDRIATVRPGWRPSAAESETLAGLAAALDGIPLALELAAARARVLGLSELLGMLRDRFPQLGPVPRGALAPHGTLEATVAWSVDLLGEPDRALLLGLWPYEGGFPLSAVDDDLDGLSALVARSVVVADTTVSPARYRLLEIVRAYCRQHDPDPVGSQERHAAWVRGLVEHHAPLLRGEHSAHSIRTLNRELLNLRAGIRHDLGTRPATALRTAGLLQWFWFRGGLVTEGLPLLRGGLAAAPEAPPTDRARAHLSAALLRYMTGDLGATTDLYAGLQILGEHSDQEGKILAAQGSYYESLYWTFRGDFDRGVEPARRSLALARRIGEEWIVPAATASLGAALAGAGRLAEGRRVLAEAGAAAVALRQTWTAAMSDLLLARALLDGTEPAPGDTTTAPPHEDPRAASTQPEGSQPEGTRFVAALRGAESEDVLPTGPAPLSTGRSEDVLPAGPAPLRTGLVEDVLPAGPAPLSAGLVEASPEHALVVLRRALTGFAEEDDVGNVLGGLHTASYALARTGNKRDAAGLLMAVRRFAARRGLDPDAADPVRTAALATLLTAADLAAADSIDEATMMSFLGPAPGQD
ncbi:AfsR/SARP family transcriptional regulator [Paractinoplanes hotanensis]|uniref:Winged helix-turn-helix domain-containing protein n=1 Tax=Paractinoplanes hotanensis TaxID=2906497 RepID=A0ABT0YBG7_9ACTN|nr:BTAD domain-containing putative transcriptional regulator [Actinoplanes hotanensis]MCM4083383.1 winged helix-turn-helix domain-containing protein [Actinoplanes hotanensis]